METVYERVAGLDIGKKTLTVCVRTPGPRGRRAETRTFSTLTRVYGAHRLTAELRDRGRVWNRKRVARLMRAAGIEGIHRRRRGKYGRGLTPSACYVVGPLRNHLRVQSAGFWKSPDEDRPVPASNRCDGR